MRQAGERARAATSGPTRAPQAATEKGVGKQDRMATLRRQRFENDLRFVLSHEQSRRFLQYLREKAGIEREFTPTAFQGPVDQNFWLGRRSLGLDIERDIRGVDPLLLVTMEQELRQEPYDPENPPDPAGKEVRLA